MLHTPGHQGTPAMESRLHEDMAPMLGSFKTGHEQHAQIPLFEVPIPRICSQTS